MTDLIALILFVPVVISISLVFLYVTLGLCRCIWDEFQDKLDSQRKARLPKRDPDDIQQIITELLVVGFDIGVNDGLFISENKDGDYQVERVFDKVEWNTTESFAEPEDAVRRFLEIRDRLGEQKLVLDDVEKNDYERIFSHEKSVLRNLFDNMRLENGRTVTEELLRIQYVTYADKSRCIGPKHKLDQKSWISLVQKIQEIAKG